MSLGYDLKRAFDCEVLSAGTPTGEVALFRCLIKAIELMRGYRACEIHGKKHQVQYIETEGWFTKKPRCELGDVAIIAFSPQKNQARFVIVQNKLSYPSRGRLGNKTSQICASLVQFELLCKRPYFELVNGTHKGKSNGLIKHSPYPSVCLYGIFYNQGSGVNMSAITADKFAFDASWKRKSNYPCAVIQFEKNFQNRANRWEPDFVAAETIEDFGDLLEDLYIGRPITSRTQKDIKDLLFNISEAHLDDRSKSIIADFSGMDIVDSLDENKREENIAETDFEDILNVCRSLVLINVDEQRSIY